MARSDASSALRDDNSDLGQIARRFPPEIRLDW
jgi:hypothetical protein